MKSSSNKQWFVYTGKSYRHNPNSKQTLTGSQPARLMKYLKISNIAFQIELLEVSLVRSLLVFKPMRILIRLGLFSFSFYLPLVQLLFTDITMVQNQSCCFGIVFEKKLTYCSYCAMCDVIFPVDYPGRTNMFMEFELKQITYLQEECTTDFVFFSNPKNKQLFQKDKLKKYQERKEIRAVPQIIKTVWYSRYLTSTSPLFLPLVKQGCILTVSKNSKPIPSPQLMDVCVSGLPIETFCVIKSITLLFWHFTIRRFVKNDPMLQDFICKAVHNRIICYDI